MFWRHHKTGMKKYHLQARERERENERDTAAATRQEGLQSGFRKSSQRVSFGPAEGQASGIQPGTDERFLLAAPIEVREDSPESR